MSLTPSATELLCAVGGERFLVGRSHECDHPPSIADRPVVTRQRTVATTSAAIDRAVRVAMATPASEGGGLYALDADALIALAPDVILTQDLCDVCSIDMGTVISVTKKIDPPPRIFSFDPRSIDDVFDDVLRVGVAVGLERRAHEVVVELRDRYWSARDAVTPYVDGPVVAFLEWMDPLFVAGHWTPQLIAEAGGRDPLNQPGERSIEITPDALVAAAPERLVISPCGYDLAAIRRELPALTKQPWWNELPAVRSGHLALVDGNQMFSRPGPRLVDAFAWLVGWINERPGLV
ncbi:MAG: ABC transporter substrate-binding protein, partial [Phycisphaerales bacterium]|nr:ABC transporter substrate-binding protein [Phycisphaerales bacterium]